MLTSEHAFILAILGSFFFPGLFLSLQYCWRKNTFGQKIKKRYELSDKECADISVKLISSLQAIFACLCGILVCLKCHKDVLYCTHPFLMVYSWFGCSYFIYDALVMFAVSRIADKHYKTVISKSKNKKNSKGIYHIIKQFLEFVSKSPVIIIHHVIMAPIGFSIIIHFRGIRGDFFVAVMFLMEASTPFVSLRFILSKLKMKSTIWYKINGTIMLVSFPVFRIASVFYTIGIYADQQKMSYLDVIIAMYPGWLFILIASITPQIYWVLLMWHGLFKIWKNEHKSSKKQAQVKDKPI